MQVNVAYAGSSSSNDVLRIWLSTNGGKSFNFLLESFYGNELSTASAAIDWVPIVEDDWETKFINLTEFVGESEVIIAFEAINGNGQNIYLDNIQFYVTNEPTNIIVDENELAIYPNPVNNLDAKISFNLDTKQDINIRIIDLQGNLISDQAFKNVLNQTYPLELSTRMNGIYIIQTIGGNFNDVRRILVNK